MSWNFKISVNGKNPKADYQDYIEIIQNLCNWHDRSRAPVFPAKIPPRTQKKDVLKQHILLDLFT